MVKRFLGLASDEVLVGMQLPLLVGKLLAAALIVVYLLLNYPDLGFAPIALLALIAVAVYVGAHTQQSPTQPATPTATASGLTLLTAAPEPLFFQ